MWDGMDPRSTSDHEHRSADCGAGASACAAVLPLGVPGFPFALGADDPGWIFNGAGEADSMP
jgi:hypothetical protein